jgi:hypothetical protein
LDGIEMESNVNAAGGIDDVGPYNQAGQVSI